MHKTIEDWFNAGHIDHAKKHQALVLAGERADRRGWFGFISRVLVLLGLLSLAVGVVFFFAYNWNDMGHMVKFAMLQSLLVAVVLVYVWKPGNAWVAQALLLSAVLVLGALLALFGQTYQTGADPWQLFATWAVLILPVVLFGRSEALWLFWLALMNTALALYFDVNRNLLGLMFTSRHKIWAYLVLNGLVWIMIDWLCHAQKQPKWLGLSHRWAAQVSGLVVIYLLVLVGLEGIWGYRVSHGVFTLIFLIMMAAVYGFLRYLRKDLLLLTAWAFGVTVYILCALGEAILGDLDASGLLILALLLIAMTTATVSWIRKLSHTFKQEASHE
ncbi:DUF2157 domain-containing protein [Marinicella sediminis]|uniref:DUF2157 domain-containing protein n=1 Tax=Marinicella sediminis TaxID=1792834 RepID=A0ABV7JAR6_9GAMM|nr:DUF2157 domain-containing protein [Marinicella sediminis]